MRIIGAAVTLVIVALALVACGGESQDMKVLKATMVYFGDNPDDFVPPLASDYACGIRPAGISAQFTEAIEGVCRWDVVEEANVWRVTFAEGWSCADFSLEVDGYPPCSGERGSHVWEWFVSEDLKVGPIGDSGNFAPDMAE